MTALATRAVLKLRLNSHLDQVLSGSCLSTLVGRNPQSAFTIAQSSAAMTVAGPPSIASHHTLPGSWAPPSLPLFHFECEVDDAQRQQPRRAARVAPAGKDVPTLTQPPQGSFFTARLRDDCAHFRRSDLEARDAVVLAVRLSTIGYSVSVRTALGPAPQQTTAVFKNLRHEFLCVQGSGDCSGVELIVEPHFREQFAIPQPTPEYCELLASLPEEYVGTAARLIPVVQIICAEMAVSFEARGLAVPPWRTAASVVSKWTPPPVRTRNMPISTATSSFCSTPLAGTSPLAGCSPVSGTSPTSSNAFADDPFQIQPLWWQSSSSKSLCGLPEGDEPDSPESPPKEGGGVSPPGNGAYRPRRLSMLSAGLARVPEGVTGGAVAAVAAVAGKARVAEGATPRIYTVRPAGRWQ